MLSLVQMWKLMSNSPQHPQVGALLLCMFSPHLQYPEVSCTHRLLELVPPKDQS